MAFPGGNRQQPHGGVKINWNRSISRGLTFAALLNIPGGLPYDLVRKERASAKNGITYGVGRGGRFAETSTDDEYIEWVESGTHAFSGDVELSVSIFLEKTAVGAGNSSTYVGHRTSFGTGLWAVNDDIASNELRFSYHDGTFRAASLGTIPPIGAHVITVVRGLGGAYTAYLDGVVHGEATSNFDLVSGNHELHIGMLGDDAPTHRVAGKYYMVMIHNRAISLREHQRIVRDPYEFVRPFQPVFGFVAPVGGATLSRNYYDQLLVV